MIEDTAGRAKELDSVSESGLSQPAADPAPSRPVTLEPEKVERPLSSKSGCLKSNSSLYSSVLKLLLLQLSGSCLRPFRVILTHREEESDLVTSVF